MKRILLLVVIVVVATGLYSVWKIVGPTISAPDDKYFYIRTGASYDEVKNELVNKKIISGTFFFDQISKQADYDKHVKPGRYEIRDGSLLELVRMLKTGRQSPVRLVINKLRTKEDLAGKMGRSFETDSVRIMNFISDNDSLVTYGLDTNTVMTIIIPNSYLFYWNTPFKKLFERFVSEKEKFWKGKRNEKAAKIGLTPEQVYTMASIIEEETNKQDDKGKIASVYMNRLQKGMKLEADPTVKYAMRNFQLKRIMHGHLLYPSEYNTYRNTGLPPGPICTPSITSIDAVLDAPKTDYIFFVAKPDFKGYSNFASSYPEHLIYARSYQRALDSLILRKRQGTF